MKTSKKSGAYLGPGDQIANELVPLTIRVPPRLKKFIQREAKREGLSPGRWIELNLLASVLQESITRANTTLDTTLANMKARADRRSSLPKPINEKAAERAAFVAELVKVVERMIPAGKEKGFNASEWVAVWLAKPHPALGGKKPEDFLDSADGRGTINRLLLKIATDAYA